MYNYCLACKVSSVAKYDHWLDKCHDTDVSNDDICYIGNDFIVRSNPLKEGKIIFDAVSPQWIEFCTKSFCIADVKNQKICFIDTDIAYREREERSNIASSIVPFVSGQWWYTGELMSSNPRYFDPVIFSPIDGNPDPLVLENTVRYLMNYHDALRLRIERRGQIWSQFVSELDGVVPLSWIDLSNVPEIELGQAIEATSYEMHERIYQFNGPLFHAAYFTFGKQKPGYILLIISHLITDAFSNDILSQDFDTIYTKIIQREIVQLPAQTTTFAQWAQRIDDYTCSLDARKEVEDYWTSLPWSKVEPIPLDFPKGISIDPVSLRCVYGTDSSSRIITVSLSRLETKTLLTQTLDRSTSIMDLLLATMAQAFVQWTGSPVLYLFVQNHGRQTLFRDISLSHTVGYIAQATRVLLDISQAQTQEEILHLVRMQLRNMPNKGCTLEWILRRQENISIIDELKNIPWADINFNFLGKMNTSTQKSAPFQEHIKLMHSSQEGIRNHALDCKGGISDGQLWMNWQYSEQIHKRVTIERFADSVLEALRGLIFYRQATRMTGHTGLRF